MNSKQIIYALLFPCFLCQILKAQVVAPTNTIGVQDAYMNWTVSKSFDEAGNVISEKKQFYDNNGRLLQTQDKIKYRKDASTTYTHVFASQPIYDVYGRPAMTTMGAPIDYSDFAYKPDFVRNPSGTTYDYRNFDRYKSGSTETDKTNTPDALGAQTVKGTLGWYYSINNTWEPYTATSNYPFSRQSYYRDGTGGVKKASGPDAFRMGNGHETAGFTTGVIKELIHYTSVRNIFFPYSEMGASGSLTQQAIQTFVKDENGREAVMIQDKNGKTLMTARAGGSDLTISNTIKSGGPKYISEFASSHRNNLRLTGDGNIFIYAGNTQGSYTQVYSGSANYTINTLTYAYYRIEAFTEFSGLYSTYGNPINVLNATLQVDVNTSPGYCYFKLVAPAVVTVTSFTTSGGYAVYDMAANNEVQVSFTSGNTLPAGYYKFKNTDNAQVQISYSNTYSDVSYSFYNQLGQLVATIAPEGVKKLIQNINAYATKTDVPFITTYEYDAQGRLVASWNAETGRSEFVYRKDGKIRFSQNALQRATGSFSYTHYDLLGRPVENGEYQPDANGIQFNSDLSVAINPMRDILENTIADFRVNLTGGLTTGTKRNVVQTLYDWGDAAHGQAGYAQDFFTLRGAVSFVQKFSTVVNNTQPLSANLVSKTWYNYDDDGNVVWQIVYINGLGYKTTDYTYDALNRLTKKVYQKNTAAETFVHYYEYDPVTEGLWKVYTNTVDNSSTKQLQAAYVYYLHGGVKRVEIGNGIQGVDYTYTLQGALKAINNADKTQDPGNDAGTGSTFLTDAFGEVLDYYTGDYSNARSGIKSIKPVNAGALVSTELYNGNIKAMSWFSKKPATDVANDSHIEDPRTYIYNYDSKYQYRENFWGTPNYTTNPAGFTPPANPIYKEVIGDVTIGNGEPYDANGNIVYLQRSNSSGVYTDKFTYHYNSNTNQLQSVVNNEQDIVNAQTYAVYTYDAIGQLTKEETPSGATSKYIDYDVTGKVTTVYRNSAKTQKVVEYVYDEMGSRIIKKTYSSTGTWIQNTYYTGDVVYSQPVSGGVGGTITADEFAVDGGSGRIGTYYRGSNIYAYEMRDHLGNVRAVVAKNGTTLEVRSYSDYYPYGTVLRSNGTSYRYGYQGTYAEKDGETNWNAFELRMYDSRIGRWLTTDPSEQHNSAYASMGNNPVSRTDPNGGKDWVEKDNQMFYDSRVTDQKSATELYGDDAVWKGVGYKYKAKGDDIIELGDLGFFKKNGEIFSSPDLAENALKEIDARIVSLSLFIVSARSIQAAQATDVAIPEPTDLFPPKWVGHALLFASTCYFIAKYQDEITDLLKKKAGPKGVQYRLEAIAPGPYPVEQWGLKFSNSTTWK